MSKTWQVPHVAGDIWRNNRRHALDNALRQQASLLALIEFARARAPFYRQRYCRFPPSVRDLHLLPPVTKSELMANFDEWVTDPAVTRTGVEAFLANKGTAPDDGG